MKALKTFFQIGLLFIILFFSGSCVANNTNDDIILVGSTPGDEEMKSMLLIPASTKIEFIKWNLKLAENDNFVMDIHFGETQPNTLGFKNGGEKLTINGTFSIAKNEGKSPFKEVYTFESKGFNGKVSMAKLNENVFHFLTAQNQLMNGNGGWSYSLNRKNPVNSGEVLISSTINDEKSLQLVFDGRTPCQEIANEHNEMKVSDACFKLKWRLILNRDSVTYLPSTYSIRKIVDGKARNLTGKWTIIKGITEKPDAIIYKIDSDNPEESMSFLVGDDNVLFFLNKNDEPYTGNENFSFSLNKKL
jgi:hypothetical protein